MKLLIVHANFPAQYHRLVNWLVGAGGHEIKAIRQSGDDLQPSRRIDMRVYKAGEFPGEPLRQARYNAGQVADVCRTLKHEGFTPDAVLGHASWGELLEVPTVFPGAVLIPYFEYYQESLRFDHYFPQFEYDQDKERRVRKERSRVERELLNVCDAGVTPSRYQRDTYPEPQRNKLHVLSEGVMTDALQPKGDARITLTFNAADGSTLPPLVLGTGDEVLTYCSRYLEAARGYDKFLQALPAIQQARPALQTLIMGVPGHHYGPPLPVGANGRPQLEQELKNRLDMKRIHYLGHVSHERFVEVLRVSRCHLYWSVPFTLSWSLMEAMALGCRLVTADNALVQEVAASAVLAGKFESSATLADLVLTVLANPERFDDMALRARRLMVEDFDANTVICPRYLKLIEECISNRPRTGH